MNKIAPLVSVMKIRTRIILLSALSVILLAYPARPAETKAPGNAPNPDERIDKTISEIEKLQKKWAGLSSLDRVAAIMAVNPVKISTYPHRVDRRAVRGAFAGETVAVSIQGDVADVSSFLESTEGNSSPLVVESAQVSYTSSDMCRADIKIFAAKKIQRPSLTEEADERIKKMFLKQLEGLLKEASKLESGRGISFRFFEEVYNRWPLGFPDLEEVSFGDKTFTVHTSKPLSRPEPLVGELARRLSEIAAPAKVNLAPLVGPLIRSREIKLSAGEDGFSVSWEGLQLFELRDYEVTSYLVEDRNVFVIFKSPHSAKGAAKVGDDFTKCTSHLRAYDIRSGSRRWELKFPGCRTPFSNMVTDYQDRLLVGRGFLLSAIEPETGKIIKRWPLSVQVKDITLPGNNKIAVYGDTPHAMGMREYIEDNARSGHLLLRAAPRSADELHETVLTRLTDKVTSAIKEKKYDYEVIRENIVTANERIDGLDALDETNPWYPFFRGVMETLKESETAGKHFSQALNAPPDNPFQYLEMGRKLERLKLWEVADKFYEKAFVKFLEWYRPADTASPFLGFIYFVTPANQAIENGNPDRAPELMKWLYKFQPFSQKTDLIALEMAARYARDGEPEESARAMERYRLGTSRGFGIGLGWLMKAAAVEVMAWVMFALFIIFAAAMVCKYRKARAGFMAEAGWPDMVSRLTAVTEPPGNFFRFNTFTFITGAEKLTTLLLWAALLALFSLTVINGRILEKQDDFLLLADYNSPRFVDRIKNELKENRSPENLFLLGLARHLNGELNLAKSHYRNCASSDSSGEVSARALNNLGVLHHETETEGKRSFDELFTKACGKDPWLPEALYNMGITRNNEAYKHRAVEYGLEKEYPRHYPDRPVRTGAEAGMTAQLLTGYRINMLRDLSSNWGRILTGNIAWKSDSGIVTGAYYLLLLLGLALIAGIIMPPRHNDFSNQDRKRRWFHLPPGLGEIMSGRPLFGVVIAAAFLFSIVLICYQLTSGVALLSDPSAIEFPLEYPDLSSASILKHEPTIKGMALFSWIAFGLSILCHSVWLFVTWRKS